MIRFLLEAILVVVALILIGIVAVCWQVIAQNNGYTNEQSRLIGDCAEVIMFLIALSAWTVRC